MSSSNICFLVMRVHMRITTHKHIRLRIAPILDQLGWTQKKNRQNPNLKIENIIQTCLGIIESNVSSSLDDIYIAYKGSLPLNCVIWSSTLKGKLKHAYMTSFPLANRLGYISLTSESQQAGAVSCYQ